MSKLGDYFPSDEKQKFVEKHLKPGQILYLFCDFTTPSKDKYLVLTCPGSKPLLFIINSEIHPFIEKRPELKKCQIKLNASDYDFLDHDSYINCSKVIDDFTEEDIVNQIFHDIRRIQGELTETTKQEVIKVVESAKTIDKRTKAIIIASLKGK